MRRSLPLRKGAAAISLPATCHLIRRHGRELAPWSTSRSDGAERSDPSSMTSMMDYAAALRRSARMRFGWITRDIPSLVARPPPLLWRALLCVRDAKP